MDDYVPSPEAIAAAWATWKSRNGGKLGPGPAFVEALTAAMQVETQGWTMNSDGSVWCSTCTRAVKDKL